MVSTFALLVVALFASVFETGTCCSCSDFVNRNGFGKCEKEDSDFGGRRSCYVNLPSSCTDLVRSGSNPEKYLSANACSTSRTGSGTSCSETPGVAGRCRAAHKRFTFSKGECVEFNYGGCGGNGNRFRTKEECQASCGPIRNQVSSGRDFPTQNDQIRNGNTQSFNQNQNTQFVSQNTGFSSQNNQFVSEDPRCSAPAFLFGSCSSSFVKWSYNLAQGSCDQFLYSGCSEGLLQNRFNTRQDCEATCLSGVQAV